MVYIARGEPINALQELDAAISDGGETPNKYFHKALAEYRAGNHLGAQDAIDRAQQLGLEVDDLSEMERRLYEQLVKALAEEAASEEPVGTELLD